MYWGGVTLEGELLASAGGWAVFVAALAAGVRTFDPSGNRGVLVPPAIILGGVLVSLFSPLPAAGTVELARMVSGALVLAAFLLIRPPDSARLLFYLSVLALGIGLVLFGILNRGGVALTGAPLTATYVNRNHIAALLGLILFPALSFSLGSKPRGAVWVSRIALPILLGGILLTRSRGGMLGTVAASSAVGLIYIHRRRSARAPGQKRLAFFLPVIVIVLGAVALYTWIHLPDSFPIPALNLEVLSIKTRLSVWRSALEVFLARPVAGWGWGTFRYVYPAFKEAGVWYSVSHAHNEFLQLLAEGGVVGFSLVAFSLVLALTVLVKRHSARPGSVGGLLALGAAGSLVYAAVHSGFDFILRLPANALLLAALVGLGLSGESGSRETPSPAIRRAAVPAGGFALAICLGVFLYLPLVQFFRSEKASRRGEQLLAAGNPGEALELFSRAHQLSPSAVRPLLGRAAARMALFDRADEDRVGIYSSIIADLETARRNNPRDTRPPRDLGHFHQRLSAFAEAGRHLEAALLIDPLNPHLHFELAENDLHRGEYISAARRLRRANEIYPMMWGASWKLLFSRTGDYEILKELPPREGKYHRLMGYYLLAEDNFTGAQREFRVAVELAPEDPKNRRALGRFFVRSGDPEQAIAHYRRALDLDPGRHQWWAELGDIYTELDRSGEALELYLRARGMEPGRRRYSEKAGAAILRLRGPQEAIAFWGRAAEEDQGWARPHYLRAKLLLEEGWPASAEEEINRALSRDPGNRSFLKLKKRIADRRLRQAAQ